jgi:CDGSH-type Zn-finger protein
MEIQDIKLPVQFRILPNGPLKATGKFTILDEKGKTIEISDEAYFCRCGASKTKPFCDGSHKANIHNRE